MSIYREDETGFNVFWKINPLHLEIE